MPAAGAHQERQARAQHVRGYDRAFLNGFETQKPGMRPSAFAERHDARASCGRLRLEPFDVLVVGGQNSCAALRKTVEDFGLGVGDVRDGVEELDMDGRHPRHDCDVRTNETRERRNLARVVHADFEHAEIGAFRHERQRKRHAPEIVVGFLRSVRAPRCRKHQAQHFLRAGLADAAGDGDDARACSLAGRAAERVQRFERIGYAKQAMGRCGRFERLLDDGGGGALFEGRRNELVSIRALALDGDKKIAALQCPAIDGDAADAQAVDPGCRFPVGFAQRRRDVRARPKRLSHGLTSARRRRPAPRRPLRDRKKE